MFGPGVYDGLSFKLCYITYMYLFALILRVTYEQISSHIAVRKGWYLRIYEWKLCGMKTDSKIVYTPL